MDIFWNCTIWCLLNTGLTLYKAIQNLMHDLNKVKESKYFHNLIYFAYIMFHCDNLNENNGEASFIFSHPSLSSHTPKTRGGWLNSVSM